METRITFFQNRRLVTAMMAAFLAVTAGSLAMAESCEEKFIRLTGEGSPDTGPVRLHIIQELKGFPRMENYNYSMGGDVMASMSEPIEPKNSIWSLFLGTRMYTSMDGKSWQFVRELDAASDPGAVRETQRNDAKTSENIVCGEEMLDGIAHETLEGDYKSSGLQGQGVHQKYWINRETQWMSKVTTHSVANGVEADFTQIIEPWPDLVLPKPE
ncbi:MAG: hypothetical protein R3D32_10285 [Nitratireductor sp.]